jgi:hypothetical protein
MAAMDVPNLPDETPDPPFVLPATSRHPDSDPGDESARVPWELAQQARADDSRDERADLPTGFIGSDLDDEATPPPGPYADLPTGFIGNGLGADRQLEAGIDNGPDRVDADQPGDVTAAPGDDQEGPVGNRPDEGATDTSPFLDAALRIAQPAERKSLRQNLTNFGKLHPEDIQKLNTRNWDRIDGDVKAAASAIWKDAADIVARAVTKQNHRREFLEALATWRDDSTREALSEEAVQRRHPLVTRFWDEMKELAEHVLRDVVTEVAQAALIEMLFPGAHLIVPPTNLVAALLTAAELGELAAGAH